MLSTGTFAAPSTCLRCQLRQAIFRTRSPSQPCFNRLRPRQCRGFIPSSRRCQEAEEALEDDQHERKGRSKLSEYPLGRIVGKPGRRQRESSARLKTDNMDKPFEVIVMRDVAEPKETVRRSGTEVSPYSQQTSDLRSQQIASKILGEDKEASQEEIEESIDLLRPNDTIVDQRQFNDLAAKLLDGYNTQQLSRYLTKKLKVSSVDADEVQVFRGGSLKRRGRLQRSTWRPGRTPLEQRHNFVGVLKKSEIGTNKSKAVQQILRLAWNLTIHSDLQEVGELEVSLKSWQTQYLFDLSSAQMPMYEAMIDSPLLRRASNVRIYRPDNVMRITARHQDAEDVGEQIERKLKDLQSLQLDLDVFKPALGWAWWPQRLDQLFEESTLKKAGQRTTTVMERKDSKTIVLYGRSNVVLEHARRTLLSLFHLPYPGSVEVTDAINASTNSDEARRQSPLLLPDLAASNLHLRYRDTKFARLTIPSRRPTKPENEGTMTHRQNGRDPESQDLQRGDVVRSSTAQKLTNRLSDIKPSPSTSCEKFIDDNSYWDGQEYLKPQPWEVQLCKILHPADNALDIPNANQIATGRKKSKAPKSKPSELSVIQPQIPGLGTLLSFFSSIHPRPLHPFLIAHFIPSPFSERGIMTSATLPRIEIAYNLYEDKSRFGKNCDLRILGMRAVLSNQELRVPLPYEAADLRIERATRLQSILDRARKDRQVRKFTSVLESSAASEEDALYGEPMIKIRLPNWLLDAETNSRQQRKDVEVKYLFEKFEQVQIADFVPLRGSEAEGLVVDPGMKKLLDEMPEDLVLSYKEVEGGVVGGRRSELRLKYKSPPVTGFSKPSETQYAETNRESVDLGQLQEATNAENDGKGEWDGSNLEAMKQRDLRLVETSLGLANALSRIGAGERRPPQKPRGNETGPSRQSRLLT